jgi:hypothetical protein
MIEIMEMPGAYRLPRSDEAGAANGPSLANRE